MTDSEKYYINKSSCYVINMLGEVSDQLLHGWNVTTVGESEKGKIFCKTDYGYSGYVDTANLSPGEYRATHRIKSIFCDVLPEAKYIGIPIDTLPMGAVVEVVEYQEKFSRIIYNGTTAYLPSAHIEKIPVDQKITPAKIIATAKKYIGTPYRWGGKTTMGIDCSGLCFMAYYLNGLKIYRDARFPFYSDYQIQPHQLRPSDLVFFKGHVALYLGKDKIIHSNSQDGKVTVSPLDYSRVLACASLYDLM